MFVFSSAPFLEKKKKEEKPEEREAEEPLSFSLTRSSGSLSARHLPGLLILFPDMNSRPCFVEPVLLPADFTAVISVSGITAVGVRCDRAECTKPWRAPVCFGVGVVTNPWGAGLIGIHSSPRLILLLLDAEEPTRGELQFGL